MKTPSPVKGVEVATLQDMYNYPTALRFWGMPISVTADVDPTNNTTWILTRGLIDTDKSNNNNFQKIADFIVSNATLVAGSARSYKKVVSGNAVAAGGAGGSFGINNPSPWANNSMVFVRCRIIGVDTTTPGGSGFFYTLEGAFLKDNAGVVTKLAAVTAGDDNPKNVRNSTGVALSGANKIGTNFLVDVFFGGALPKNYSVTIETEYIYTT